MSDCSEGVEKVFGGIACCVIVLPRVVSSWRVQEGDLIAVVFLRLALIVLLLLLMSFCCCLG
jgi:hypothetical protein